ncbi:spermidine/putrescine transport system ATP-binding protein [Streptomyces azureus]|uniref:Spermidine/putrescine transport system ATP-binding protein n=1 Tax=Streptomyces azureus TaxID=146537 RepID=A0A0K8PJS8_STRAJ|nr:spermidine/putrescine transport system ATP-binding protein [Streptomyces azureus]
MAAPPLDRPLADPQRGSYLPVLVPTLEAFHGPKPDPLPRGPPSVGQPAALRVSHGPELPELSGRRQANGADISSSVVAWQRRKAAVEAHRVRLHPVRAAAASTVTGLPNRADGQDERF